MSETGNHSYSPECSTEHREVGWVKTKAEKKGLVSPSPGDGGQTTKRNKQTLQAHHGRWNGKDGDLSNKEGRNCLTRKILYMTFTSLATCDF